MLVFVDESGDTGLKFDQGSSLHFVVTLVIFGSVEDAESVRRRVDELRQARHLPPTYEFHFVRNNVHVRRAFLNAVRSYDFQFLSLVVDKRRLTGAQFQTRSGFYRAVCGVAFDAAKPLLRAANVQFDDSGERAAKKDLASYLRRRVNGDGTERIKNVGTQRSAGNNLIQLADMVCGAVYRSCQGGPSAGEYRNTIKHREFAVLPWPD